MATATRPTLNAPNGVAKFYWLPAIADDSTLVPTRPEITAGDDLTALVNAIAGGDSAPQYEDFDLMDNSTAAKVFVGANLNDLSVTFGRSRDGAANQDIYDFMAEGDDGFMVVAPGGDVTGYRATVYKAAVSVMSDVVTARQANRVTVGFTVSARAYVDLPATA